MAFEIIFNTKMLYPGGKLYTMETYRKIFKISIKSGEDGSIILPSFDMNFTNEID